MTTPARRIGDRHAVVLRWPEQRTEAERLVRDGVPTLLLVEPGADPPVAGSCIEDWVRLPAPDADVRARLEALAHRAGHHPAVPVLDGYGECSFGGRRVFLSPTDDRIAAVLAAAFGRGVAESELLAAVWPGETPGGHAGKLRVHVSRLRKRLAPLGLEITAVRNFGYRMHGTATLAGQEAVSEPSPPGHAGDADPKSSAATI